MERTSATPRVRTVRTRNGDARLLVGGAVLALFAVIGVISTGAWAAQQLNGAKSSAAPSPASAGVTVARAQAQATAIVQAAHLASADILAQSHHRAQQQAHRIVATAQRRAARLVQSAAAQTPAQQAPAQPASQSTTSSSTVSSSGSQSSGQSASNTTTASGPVSTAIPTAVPVSGSAAAASRITTTSPPNTAGLPASWKVIGYNATFGHGPGSAGSVSVYNRGTRVLSGTVQITYGGQVATATFTDLGPGQAGILPLNGPAYSGQKYRITITNVHSNP